MYIRTVFSVKPLIRSESVIGNGMCVCTGFPVRRRRIVMEEHSGDTDVTIGSGASSLSHSDTLGDFPFTSANFEPLEHSRNIQVMLMSPLDPAHRD